MKILVLGCGNIGSVIAEDLAESLPSAEITLADMSKKRAEETVSKIDRDYVSWVQIDASEQSKLVNTLRDFDLAIGALPGETGYQVCRAAIVAGVDLVDVSYMPEDVMTLHESALKAGISVLPDCGMSPGLGNILIGHAITGLDQVESVHILNGGLPEEPLPPLGYVITWSVKDLIDMYLRKVNIVKEGKIVQTDAMDGLEEMEFPGFGKLEAFYTDGLRTLLHTVKDVKEMWEKTLRYPGHVESIKLLKTLGFFDEEPMQVGDMKVSPRELTERLFEAGLRRPGVPDIVALRVRVTGTRDASRAIYSYDMLERYDKERQVTAMARTTAYTASAAAQLLAKRSVTEKGVIPPEKLGMNKELYSELMKILRKREIEIKESVRTAQ